MKWMIFILAALVLCAVLTGACGENIAEDDALEHNKFKVDAVVRYDNRQQPHLHGGSAVSAAIASQPLIMCFTCVLVTGMLMLMAKRQ